MTKEVLVSIRGAHAVGGETEGVEVITAGSYYYKNSRHYVIYDELLEGFEKPVRSTIRIGGDTVDIIKNGPVRSHLIFEANKTNVSCYSTPLGQMTVGISTNRIQVDETEDRLSASVDYTMDINYEQVSSCQIVMDIQSKEKADFHLTGEVGE